MYYWAQFTTFFALPFNAGNRHKSRITQGGYNVQTITLMYVCAQSADLRATKLQPKKRRLDSSQELVTSG